MESERIAIAGGGAAGFFAAIACAEAEPRHKIVIYERTSQFLQKVRISGGGRCNVTHTPTLDPREFTTRYPRGERALIGALSRFSAEDTVAWFQQRAVRLKTESDGRMFPITDSSGTVIDCLLDEANAAGIQLVSRNGVEAARQLESGAFELTLTDGTTTECDRLLLATGGSRAPLGAEIAHSLGHTLKPPVPSLFSLHIETPWLCALPGIAVADVELRVAPDQRWSRPAPGPDGTGSPPSRPPGDAAPQRREGAPAPTPRGRGGSILRERGPLLITHNGISGPVVLRLSAWGARLLAQWDYKFPLHVNWLPGVNVTEELQSRRATQPKRHVANSPLAPLPARLWEQLVLAAGIPAETLWTNLTRAGADALVRLLTRCELPVDGKSLNKDEFVTCGGVTLREVNFKTMESRLVPHLYFAGELLDIDGITGGFNFQAAWTTGWIAGQAMGLGSAGAPPAVFGASPKTSRER